MFGIKYSLFPALFSFALFFSAYLSFKKTSQEPTGAVSFSGYLPLPFQKRSFKAKAAAAVSLFPHLAFALLLLAAVNPHQEEHFSYFLESPKEGRFLFLLVDQSGSMNTDVTLKEGFGREKQVRKMDLARSLSAEFISGLGSHGFLGRKGDLIGLVRFAKRAQIVLPPTFDNLEAARQLERIDVQRDNSSLGTAIGYAVYKALNVIEMTKKTLAEDEKAPFTLLDTAIVIVTDGFEEISEENKQSSLHTIDIQEASLYAKQLGVKLYMVNIDPSFSAQRYFEERETYKHLMQMTGGEFFMVSSSQGLKEVFGQIEKLQPSSFKEKTFSVSSMRYLGFPLIVSACVLLVLYVCFFSFFGRRA